MMLPRVLHMMTGEQSSKKHLSFPVLRDFYYQDTLTVMVKGLELELVKILTLFTSIDISSNSFSGKIPNTIGYHIITSQALSHHPSEI
ncbi:hypothetical protein OSB04_024900 [Centaurea solstitialis]|uniref:Uncharacterized protein n=1 Tax=Centaurea solstitialis TaxID=347529 RepID=A0AA38SUK0_9ASTR|nr:hypothetical protein OSB04_024900 [Centaurea solstitialis]